MSTGKFTPTPVYHPTDSTKVIWSGRGRKSKAYKELYPNGHEKTEAAATSEKATEATDAK